MLQSFPEYIITYEMKAIYVYIYIYIYIARSPMLIQEQPPVCILPSQSKKRHPRACAGNLATNHQSSCTNLSTNCGRCDSNQEWRLLEERACPYHQDSPEIHLPRPTSNDRRGKVDNINGQLGQQCWLQPWQHADCNRDNTNWTVWKLVSQIIMLFWFRMCVVNFLKCVGYVLELPLW